MQMDQGAQQHRAQVHYGRAIFCGYLIHMNLNFFLVPHKNVLTCVIVPKKLLDIVLQRHLRV